MDRRRDTHRVTCKCVLFSLDRKKVLVVDYGKEGYGLPGGHIDEGESPDTAMARELFEELGLKEIPLKHADFGQHRNGKIVLGYHGAIDVDTPLVPQDSEMKRAVWVEVKDIVNGKIEVPSYKNLIVGHYAV